MDNVPDVIICLDPDIDVTTDTDKRIYTLGVDIIPYHVDDSDLLILRYHGGEIGGDPFTYDNDETTGLYSSAIYDHFEGRDLVAWYVSDYTNVKWCNPGPWTEVEV